MYFFCHLACTLNDGLIWSLCGYDIKLEIHFSLGIFFFLNVKIPKS